MKLLTLMSIFLVFSVYAKNDLKSGWIDTAFGPKKVYYKLVDGIAIAQGDMELEVYPTKNLVRQKGAGAFDSYRKWSRRTIPYTIDPNIPNKERIYDAIKHYHQETQIKLVKRTNERAYVEFKFNGENGSCSSFIGRKCPWCKQQIRVPNWCRAGSIIHEIGHALGMIHEHTRWDRGNYVKINWDNIKEDAKSNFYRFPLIFRSYTRFDFGSIMMYGPYAFAIDGSKPTITKKDGSTYSVQRNGLSNYDKQALAKMYNY